MKSLAFENIYCLIRKLKDGYACEKWANEIALRKMKKEIDEMFKEQNDNSGV